MPSRKEVEGYDLSVFSRQFARHWQGYVHIAGPGGEQLKTVETGARHATPEDAERAALTIATNWVRERLADE